MRRRRRLVPRREFVVMSRRVMLLAWTRRRSGQTSRPRSTTRPAAGMTVERLRQSLLDTNIVILRKWFDPGELPAEMASRTPTTSMPSGRGAWRSCSGPRASSSRCLRRRGGSPVRPGDRCDRAQAAPAGRGLDDRCNRDGRGPARTSGDHQPGQRPAVHPDLSDWQPVVVVEHHRPRKPGQGALIGSAWAECRACHDRRPSGRDRLVGAGLSGGREQRKRSRLGSHLRACPCGASMAVQASRSQARTTISVQIWF